jgi:hypothetical protein
MKLYIDSDFFSNYEEFLLYMNSKLASSTDESSIKNLDILSDVLRGGFGLYEENEKINIKWKNYHKSISDLGYEETTQYYLKILEKCHPSNKNEVKFLIQQSMDHEGKTLFYLILEVFFDAKNVSNIEFFTI